MTDVIFCCPANRQSVGRCDADAALPRRPRKQVGEREGNGTAHARHGTHGLARELKISPRLPLPRVGQADVDARPAETAGACARTDDMATIPFSPAFYASPLVFLSCSFRPRWRLWLWRWFSRHPVTGRQLWRSRVAWRISTVALRSSVEKEYGNGNGDHRTSAVCTAV